MPNAERRALVRGVGTVCDLVRTMLGPYGANKLVVEADGSVATTSAGAAVLERIAVEDPAVTLLTRAAMDFEAEHGAGATTMVTLVGALLDEAERLVDAGLHPTAVAGGYREALAVASDDLDRRSRPLSAVGVAAVAETALASVRDPAVREHVSAVIESAADVLTERHGANAFDHDRLGVVARTGGAHGETELVPGVAMEGYPVSDAMPRRVDGGIGLVSGTIDFAGVGADAGDDSTLQPAVSAAGFEERAAIADRERERFHEDLAAAVDAGCVAVATTESVADRVQTILANHGVVGLHRVDDREFDRIARLTGATVVPGLGSLDADVLGRGEVAVLRKARRDFSVVRPLDDGAAPIYTLFCRAPDPRSVEAFERAVGGAIAAVGAALREARVVPGGGAAEMAAAHAVRQAARSIDSRERLAVEGFARALASVPRLIAHNAGMDGQAIRTRLHVAHAEGRTARGVDVFADGLRDVLDGDPIVEPTATKRAVLSAATDLAIQLVRIDDRLPATDLDPEETRRRRELERGAKYGPWLEPP